MYGTWQTNKPGLELLQDTWEDVEATAEGRREDMTIFHGMSGMVTPV
jgi:hypothetical protein